MEKIHGTNTWIRSDGLKFDYHCGGETNLQDGGRAICKHKCGLNKISDLLQKVQSSKDIVENWVTSMRADHVLDKILHRKPDPSDGSC